MPRISDNKFTERSVKQAKPKSRRYTLRDISRPGLLLRVSPTGAKNWYAELDRGTARVIGNAKIMPLTQAWDKCVEMKAAHIKGETPEKRRAGKPTLKAFIEGDYKDYAEANLAVGDQDVKRMLVACKSLLKKRLDKITEFDVEKWKRSRLAEVKPVTVKRDLAKLKSALNLAVRWGTLQTNPAKKVTIKVPKEHVVRYLADEERKRLFAAMAKRDRKLQAARDSANEWRTVRGQSQLPTLTAFGDHLTPLVTLVLNTGLRKSEALTLEWGDIQLQGAPVLTVRAAATKAKKMRHVPLNRDAVDVLRKWKGQGSGEGPVFPHPETGLPIRDIKTAWLHLLKDAKIENFRFHDLRHDFASRLVMGGVDLYRVKELLGHGTITMTERYAHLAPAALSEAVATISTR